MEHKNTKQPPVPPGQTEGVKILLGDPKKAVIKLSIPMIVAVSAHTIYNLADAIWVSGKGPESISAVGFTFPFIFFAMAIGNGIGIGGGAAISRKIGAKDKKGADIIASHTFVIMLICSVFFTAALLLLARPALNLMGAGNAIDLCLSYARILFSGIFLTFFLQVGTAILRSEGDAKRAMIAMMASSVLNIILDPIFIYTLDMGVAGAAWATIITMVSVSIVLFYWLFIEKKTFVSFRFRGFRFDKEVLKDIGKIGFPASISQVSMSIMSFLITAIVASIDGPRGVAIYTSGWRVVSLFILPMFGVAGAVVAVSGAAYGAKDFNKMRIAYMFAIKAGVLVEIVLALFTVIFAPQITWIFTWSPESALIVDDLILFLRVFWLFYPTVAIGMLSVALFQGAGKGIISLTMSLFRSLVLSVPFAWLGGIFFDGGLFGVWIGTVSASLLFSPVAFGCSVWYLKKLIPAQS